MARYRTYTIELKRQVVEEHLSGGTGLNQLARRHDISRELLRTWVKKHEAGDLAGGRPRRTGAPTRRRSPAWSARSAS
jgi:transposase-like protein